jgi:uncharacterized protein with von Willebrand factor type A (vWA) domain
MRRRRIRSRRKYKIKEPKEEVKLVTLPGFKGVLIEDYTHPLYRAFTRGVLLNPLLENKNIPFYIAMDSSIIHYKHWGKITLDPQVEDPWKAILEKYYNSDAYRKLNETIAGDPLLTKYATIHFLNKLFEESLDEIAKNKYPSTYTPQQQFQMGRIKNPVGEMMDWLRELAKGENKGAVERFVSTLADTLIDEAKESTKDVSSIQSFSHAGIPTEKLLEKPEELRKILRNKIIISLIRILRKLKDEAPSLKRLQAPTLVGGRPFGVKNLQRFSELPRLLPFEYLDDDLMTYKVASRTVKVTEQYGHIQNYVVYLDKSGSMAGLITYHPTPLETDFIPKISFASASALALATKLRKLGAKLTLKLFDVDVHKEVKDYEEIFDILARIQADSGTNLTKVLEDATKYRDEKIIIITDGIDVIDEKAVQKAKVHNLDITVIFINTDNALLRKNFPHVYLQEAKPEILFQI